MLAQYLMSPSTNPRACWQWHTRDGRHTKAVLYRAGLTQGTSQWHASERDEDLGVREKGKVWRDKPPPALSLLPCDACAQLCRACMQPDLPNMS